MRIGLLSVNVATPSVLLARESGDVISAIDKRPVEALTVRVGRINIEGDAQADTRPSEVGGQVHGGVDKAVYAYSADHNQPWQAVLRRTPAPGLFGENLTVAGAVEDEVYVGDLWQWGEVLLEVAQPRMPCYKLGIKVGAHSVRRQVREHGRTGWYLRVLQEGTAPTSGPIEVTRPGGRLSIARLNHALQHRTPLSREELGEPALAGAFANFLLQRDYDLTFGVPETD